MPRPIRGVLIDDDPRDSQKIGGKLSASRGLKIVPIGYDQNTIDRTTAERADVIVVDYQLAQGNTHRSWQPTLGSTFSAFLREKFKETPIILITRGTIFDDALTAARDLPGLFDEILVKADVSRHPEVARKTLMSIVAGYRRLRSIRQRSWERLCSTLGAQGGEVDLLFQSAPPREALGPAEWRVPEVAQWMRNTLLNYPGVLYDPAYASSALGISANCFASTGMRRYFAPARYRGPFLSPEERWWKPRLITIAAEFFERVGRPDLPLHHFGQAWNDAGNKHVELSRCIVDGTSPAECVCFVYEKPVKRVNSLPYRPDNRPAVMDEARVSFKAIRESNEFDEQVVATDSRYLVAEIRSG